MGTPAGHRRPGRRPGRPGAAASSTAAAAVAEALARRGSVFNEPDVLVALAESCPAGLAPAGGGRLGPALVRGRRARGGPASAQRPRPWASTAPGHRGRRPLMAGGPPPGPPRSTTRLVDLAVEARFARSAQVSPAVAELELAALGTGGRLARAACQLACSGEGVAVLPPAPWLDQAACVDAARAIWQAAGMTVEVACPSELSARRWRALTSLEEPGTARDGRASPVLGRPARSAGARGRRRRPHRARWRWPSCPTRRPPPRPSSCSSSGARCRGQARAWPGRWTASPTSWRARRWPTWPGRPSLAGAATPAISLSGIVVQGSLTGAAAMAQLVAARGTADRGAPVRGAAGPPERTAPLMVAFGPAEAEALNTARRAGHAGTPPEGRAANRSSAARVRRGRPGPGPAAHRPGTRRPPTAPWWRRRRGHRRRRGGVAGTGTAGPRTSLVGPEHAPFLGYGYATTVPYLRSCDPGRDSLLVLGDPLGPGRPGRPRSRRLGHPGRPRLPRRRGRRPGGAAPGRDRPAGHRLARRGDAGTGRRPPARRRRPAPLGRGGDGGGRRARPRPPRPGRRPQTRPGPASRGPRSSPGTGLAI